MRQDPPNSIQMEATEGCNLRCSFCGIRGIREPGKRGELSGPYRYMDPGTAALVARQVAGAGWNPRIEWAMHGEPTQNPDLPVLVRVMRQHLPRVPIMLTTNALPMLDRWDAELRALFDAGVDTIAVDNYRPYAAEPYVRNTVMDGITVMDYPGDGPAANPHHRPQRGERRLVLVKDISQATEGTHSNLTNHAGAAGPLDHTRDSERCALPFRELSVRWDGNVALCCNDWRGQYKAGNVATTPLPDIWQGPAFTAARHHLYSQGRDFAPCSGCTHRTVRNGLLPDRMGKRDLPPPGPEHDQAIAAALAGAPYTRPVPRKWELPLVAGDA